MNILNVRFLFRNAWRLAALVAVIISAAETRAQEQPQPGRFLLVFETSPALKKNLPDMEALLASLFASNLQGQIQMNDDVAVWTVDETLHTGTFPLASWAPEEADVYAQQLKDFLGRQKYNKRANLTALQPLLNRVAKSSDRLTVLIFCDSGGRLLGTPYDNGVNEIITNAAARPKGGDTPFVLVLRSYHGEYLGCSVNRSSPLNFPKFPPQPKPEPPPVTKPAPAPAPVATQVSGPVVTRVAAMIIVGTNASTNASALLPPTPAPTPPPAVTTNEPVTSPTPPATTAPTVKTAVAPPVIPPVVAPQVTAPPVATPPVVTPKPESPPSVVVSHPAPPPPAPTPAPLPAAPKTSTPVTPVTPAVVTSPPPAVAVVTPPVVVPASPPVTDSNEVTAAAESKSSDTLTPWLIGGGSLAVAAVLVVWFVTRGRHPRGSLITSSMQNDPRLPPRK